MKLASALADVGFGSSWLRLALKLVSVQVVAGSGWAHGWTMHTGLIQDRAWWVGNVQRMMRRMMRMVGS